MDEKTELETALDAMQEVFEVDKGFHEDEWIKWCNDNLPFMHKHGRLNRVLGYS